MLDHLQLHTAHRHPAQADTDHLHGVTHVLHHHDIRAHHLREDTEVRHVAIIETGADHGVGVDRIPDPARPDEATRHHCQGPDLEHLHDGEKIMDVDIVHPGAAEGAEARAIVATTIAIVIGVAVEVGTGEGGRRSGG